MADNMMDGLPHDCEKKTKAANIIREGLQATPLVGPQLTLFTDGCCFRAESGLRSALAVVKGSDDGLEILDACPIEGKQSAQRAEI